MMIMWSGFLGAVAAAALCAGCALDWTVSGSGTGGAGGSIGTTKQIPCTSGQTCTCPAGATCSMTCTGAACDLVCAAGSDCTINCTGSDCQVACAAGATCSTACSGTCTIDCDAAAACTCAPAELCQ